MKLKQKKSIFITIAVLQVLIGSYLIVAYDSFIVDAYILLVSFSEMLLAARLVRPTIKYRRWQQLRRNGGSHTELEWSMLKWRQGLRCAKCMRKAPLTKDHIIPCALGGTDDIENIQGLCQPCNSSKGIKIIDYR
jgi:hypothetical protein